MIAGVAEAPVGDQRPASTGPLGGICAGVSVPFIGAAPGGNMVRLANRRPSMDQDTRQARQSLRNFKRLLALEPNHTGHLEQLARLSSELGQGKQAARYWLQRADVLAERDEPGAALGSVHMALEADPRNERARIFLERLQAATPAGEILLPEGPAPLPVKDDLLAVDGGLFEDDDFDLDSAPPPDRQGFLPRARHERVSTPPGAPGAIADVAARLSAGLVRREGPSARPAALDAAPPGGNDLVSDLASVADEPGPGEITRDFTIERVDAARIDDVADRGGRDRGPIEASDEIQILHSDEFEVVSIGAVSRPAGDAAPTMFDVSADDVLEIRPETGPLPQVSKPTETFDMSYDSFGDSLSGSLGGSLDGSTVDLHASDVDTEKPTDPPPALAPETFASEPFDPGPSGPTVVDRFPAALAEGRSQVVRVGGRTVPVGSVFGPLPRPVLEDLIERAVRRTVRIGVPIVRAGDRFEGPLLLVRGRAGRETGGDDRHPALLAPADGGELLGLVELVRGGRWRISIRAELECDLLALPVRAVDEARGDHPAWEQGLREGARRMLADQLLAASSLFGHMAPEHRDALSRKFVVRMFGPGDALVEPGQPADGLYMIIGGEVDVERDRAYLTTLSEGDFVGVVAALEKSPTQVRAVAATPVEAFFLDPPSIRSALRVPEVRAAFEAVVERRRTVLEGGHR